MRDLMMMGAMLVMVSLAMSNAFIAYMLWGWAGMIALDNYLYGAMANVPYVQIFALMTLGLILMRRDKQQIPFKLNRTMALLAVFGFHSIVVAGLAFEGIAQNAMVLSVILKTLLFCLVMPMLSTSRLRVHALVLIIVLGFSFHGLIDGLKFLASGGGHIARGLGKFGDNNYFAMILAMIVPLALYLYRYTQAKLIKLGFLAVTLLIVFAVMATKSRGGMLTLVVIGVWMIFHSQRKALGIVALLTTGALVMALAPADWTERMNTVQNVNDDSSFMTRVAVWKKSTAIALDYPFVGGGFYAAQSPPTYEKYRTAQGLLGFIATPDPAGFAAHSIYFQVIGDMGFLGFFIYMAMLLNTFFTRYEINKLAKAQGSRALWAADLSIVLAASMVAFMVGGALLSAAYFEVPFLIIALMESTKQVLLSNKN